MNSLVGIKLFAQFKKMRDLILAPERVLSSGVQKGLVREVLPKYRECVKALKNVLKAEEEFDLSPGDTNLTAFLAGDQPSEREDA